MMMMSTADLSDSDPKCLLTVVVVQMTEPEMEAF